VTTSLLAYIPSPAQGVWHLGPVPIRAYALCIITGIIAALIIGDRRWVARGGEQGVIYDIALWTVPFGLIGGRLYHLMTDWRTYFAEGGAGFAGAVRIWDGGLGIWGAVALGGVGAWIGCRRHGIPLPAFGDAVAPGVILAQAIGRLGNYFNQELYGRPTDLPWGLQIFQRSDGSGVVNPHLLNGVSTGQVYDVVHPTFLYELLWNLLVFFFLLWADRRFRLGHGRLFALYVAAYCVGRFGVELMRSDTATLIAGIRVNSFTSTFVFIGAVVYMMVAPRGREDPSTLGGRQADDIDADSGSGADVGAAGAALAVPVAVGVVAGAGEDDDAVDVADEADAVETQPDETVALAEQAVEADEPESESDEDEDEDAVDAEAAVEESADESVEQPVDSDEVEEEDESDTDAEELAADEPEVDAVEVAEESEGTTESDEAADEAAAETEVADADDSADAEDAAEDESVEVAKESEQTSESEAETDAEDAAEVEAAEVAEESEGTTESDEAADEAAAETEVADADDSADAEDAAAADDAVEESEQATDSEAVEVEAEDEAEDAESPEETAESDADTDAEPAEEAAPKVEATEKVEPVGVPVWEPPAPRRRWWRRQG